MKVLMRADTHVTFNLPDAAPQAKCTLSQVPQPNSSSSPESVLTVVFWLFQVVTALSVSLVSLVVGFVSAYTSPAAHSLKKDLGVNDDEVSPPPINFINSISPSLRFPPHVVMLPL